MSRETVTRRLALSVILGLLVAGSLSAYVLLSPLRWWTTPPTLIVDNRGQSTITDSDHGVSRTIAAITSNQAWNGAGSGNLLNAVAGPVASWQLGDGTPMLSFQDPVNGCKGTCLAATYTGYANAAGDGTYRFYDADIVTNARYDWATAGEPDGCPGGVFLRGV